MSINVHRILFFAFFFGTSEYYCTKDLMFILVFYFYEDKINLNLILCLFNCLNECCNECLNLISFNLAKKRDFGIVSVIILRFTRA